MAYIMINGVIYDSEIDSNGNYEINTETSIQATDVITSDTRMHSLDAPDFASDSHTITVEDVYNRIQINCDCDDLDTVIESPLNEDDLYSDYSSQQHYAREFASFGEGKDAANAFIAMCHDENTNYENVVIYDWYLQQMRSHRWQLNTDSMLRTDNLYQTTIPKWMFTSGNEGLASIFRMAYTKREKNLQDNAIVNNMTKKDYLVIALLGRGPGSGKPELSTILSHAPVAVYQSSDAVGRYSPTDSETTNYFVISGKIGLAPRGFVTEHFGNMQSINDRDDIWHATVHLDDDRNSDGAYYTIEFFDNPSPKDKEDTPVLDNKYFLSPFNTAWKDLKALQYMKSEGDIDRISFVPFLAAQMKIGDKYCVDFFDSYNDFPEYRWLELEDCPEYDDGTGSMKKRTFFTIGCNPAWKDWLVGKQYDICNMISPAMNLEGYEGQAIPIKETDNLSGRIEFKILGPAWTTVQDGIRYYYHRTWGNWLWGGTVTVVAQGFPVYQEADSMWIEDLKIRVVSDNGLNSLNDNDKQLVYTTDAELDEGFVNVKDDIDFRISTQLTTEEANRYGLNNKVKINNPSLVDSNQALRSVYNTVLSESGKPEEHYLDHYFKEYSQPRITFDLTIHDAPHRNWTTHFELPTQFPDKEFFIQSENYDVKLCRKRLTVKESHSL